MAFLASGPDGFQLGGNPRLLLGFNAYYLAYCSSETQISVLSRAQALGANVIRAWAFRDEQLSLKDSPGQQGAYNVAAQGATTPLQQFSGGSIVRHEIALRKLDSLIYNAESLGIGLLLPLVNHWGDFGGMPLYVSSLTGSPVTADFYTSGITRSAYRDWMEYLVTRRNTFTGRFYADEPAIFAWELSNELRGASRTDLESVTAWIDDHARLLHTFDPNHLVAAGDEGFFDLPESRHHLYDGRYAIDAERILNLPAIDFGTFHLYPEHWGYRSTTSSAFRFGMRWIDEHLALGRQAGKPVLLEEFGLQHVSSARREKIYHHWVRQIVARKGGGALLWMLGSSCTDAREYRDNFIIY